MNLASIDLNLLLVFDAIMQEKNVTRAGDRIGMSQPAMSNALNRLRYHINDELFVRSSEGMLPTPRAVELSTPIRGALDGIESALDPTEFDPLISTRTFTIGTNDYCVSILIPKLAAAMQQDAPNINIRLMSSAGHTFEMLDSQEIDFGISAISEVPDRYGNEICIEDKYVLLMRKNHPLSKGKITNEQFANARHMVISPRGETHGFVDDDLAKINMKRTIAMVVNHFSSAPSILANSDLILTAPKRIADIFAPLYSLTIRPAPFKGEKTFSSVKLIWHKKLANHSGHNWFREYLQSIARSL
jgi:DNA-binding transcriptional LysR family regulator